MKLPFNQNNQPYEFAFIDSPFFNIIKSLTISILILVSGRINSISITSEMIFQKISYDQKVTYASLIPERDSSDVEINEREKSDLFYYILGIIILIAAGIIFKQRYEQYLKDKDRLNL